LRLKDTKNNFLPSKFRIETVQVKYFTLKTRKLEGSLSTSMNTRCHTIQSDWVMSTFVMHWKIQTLQFEFQRKSIERGMNLLKDHEDQQFSTINKLKKSMTTLEELLSRLMLIQKLKWKPSIGCSTVCTHPKKGKANRISGVVVITMMLSNVWLWPTSTSFKKKEMTSRRWNKDFS
jgi:hypothetical protein